jgi:hypothetical protein
MFTFFTISAGDITSIIGYAGNLVADFMPLLVVFVGIAIGVYIISRFELKKLISASNEKNKAFKCPTIGFPGWGWSVSRLDG